LGLGVDDLTSGNISRNYPAYFTFIGSGLILFITGLAILFKKWRTAAGESKSTLGLILYGLITSALLALLFSILNALLVLREPYLYFYSSVGIFAFVAALAFALIKYGALGATITFSRKILIIGFVLAISFAVMSLL